MPGGSQGQTQTTQVNLSPQQRRLFGMAMPFLQQFANRPPDMPTGSGVQGFDPLQTKGQNQVLNSTGTMRNVVGSAARGNEFLTSGQVLDPSSNKYLAANIEGATRPVIDNLMESVLPNIRGSAVGSGNYGSSRQGIAEGLATGKAATAMEDTAARLASEGYNSGLDAMTKGIGLSGQVAQNLAIPGQATSGVGDVRQNLAQRTLDDARQREMYEKMLPLFMGQSFAGIGSGMPGAGATTTASGGSSNLFSQILGGASSLGSLFGGMGQLGQGASGLTALLPFLCDRSQKTHVERVGTALDGTPLYIFRYALEPHRDVIGPMADELDERFVYEKDGLQYIRAREWAHSMKENSNGSHA